jgi:hypothetical protein
MAYVVEEPGGKFRKTDLNTPDSQTESRSGQN